MPEFHRKIEERFLKIPCFAWSVRIYIDQYVYTSKNYIFYETQIRVLSFDSIFN